MTPESQASKPADSTNVIAHDDSAAQDVEPAKQEVSASDKDLNHLAAKPNQKMKPGSAANSEPAPSPLAANETPTSNKRPVAPEKPQVASASNKPEETAEQGSVKRESAKSNGSKKARSKTGQQTVTVAKPAIDPENLKSLNANKSSIAPAAIESIDENDLRGMWTVSSSVLNGQPIPNDEVRQQSLTIYRRDLGSSTLIIHQGDMQEKAKITFGVPIELDRKMACPLTIVADLPGSPTVEGLFRKSEDGIEMIWSAPGTAAPKSFDASENKNSRILELKRAN